MAIALWGTLLWVKLEIDVVDNYQLLDKALKHLFSLVNSSTSAAVLRNELNVPTLY